MRHSRISARLFSRKFAFSRGGFHPHVSAADDPLGTHKGQLPPIEVVGVLPKVELPLLQHIGPVARPLVDIGERVRAGQLVARTDETPPDDQPQNYRQSFLYSRIHSPINGMVTAIENRILANGLKAQSIVVEHEELSWEASEPAGNWRGRGCKEILERMARAGIVGLGGATFPTDVKLRLPIKRRCDYLLLNAAECEPYLHSDASLLRERAFEVIGGIDVLAEALKPGSIVIGLKDHKLLPRLREALRDYRHNLAQKEEKNERALLPPIRIALLQTRYPQGAERQLVEAITGQEVPPGKLPLEVGCVVVNVATCKATYDALERGLPLTRHLVTIGGGAVRQPKVFDAPLGTPLLELLRRCGGLWQPVARMVNGGPMMGTSFYDFDQFITKGSNGFLFLTAREVGRKKERPCIHCNACIEVCPMGLEPTAMYKQILSGKLEQARKIGLLSCIECGACASVCPSQIALTQGFRMGKLHWRSLEQEQL